MKNFTVCTAESCTGGNIAHQITLVAGSSAYYVGGVVSYANEVKINTLGVPAEYIEQNGAVSKPVVEAMAMGVRKITNSDYSIATSGIAGPGGGSAEKPVGTVWMASGSVARNWRRASVRINTKGPKSKSSRTLPSWYSLVGTAMVPPCFTTWRWLYTQSALLSVAVRSIRSTVR